MTQYQDLRICLRSNKPRVGSECSTRVSKENTYDKVRTVGSSRSPVCNGRNAGAGARSHLQPRLLRSVLSERQLPEQRTKQSLYRRLSAPEPDSRRVCLERGSLRDGCRVLYWPRWPPPLLLLSNS